MPSTNVFESFIAGAVGGMGSESIGYPFDTIKVRLQTMPKPADGEKFMYSGARDCLKQTIKKEGFFALYKGISAPIAGVIPLSAVFFSSCACARWLQQKKPGDELTFAENCYAGAFAGFSATLVSVPIERVKCLLQVQAVKKLDYNGPLDVIQKLYKQGGIKCVYRGFTATQLREIPASAAYLSTYEYLKKKFSGDNKEIPPLAAFAAGGFAGIANWTICLPADVIKSRLQTAPDGTYPNGIRSVAREIMRNEGLLGFYHGFVPVILRAFPANATCFVFVELTLKLFRRFKEQ